MIVLIFLVSAIRTTRMIQNAIDVSKEDPTFLMINTSRKAAMKNVWTLLIWLLVVVIESFTYSFTIFVLQ